MENPPHTGSLPLNLQNLKTDAQEANKVAVLAALYGPVAGEYQAIEDGPALLEALQAAGDSEDLDSLPNRLRALFHKPGPGPDLAVIGRQIEAAFSQNGTRLEALEAAQGELQAFVAGQPQGPSRAQVLQALGKLNEETAGELAVLVGEYIAWHNRPTARLSSEITESPPATLLRAKGQDGPLLVAGKVAILSGAGGTGKSRLALQMALAMAAGQEIDGLWEVAGGSALVVGYEDVAAVTAQRLRAQAVALDCRGGLGRVHVLDLAGWPLFGPQESYNARPQRLPGWWVLEREAARVKPRLLVIDPALAAYVGDQNQAAPVREFVDALSRLSEYHQAAVLLVCHSAKAARKDKDGPFAPGLVSGSAAWHDAARASLTLTRNPEDSGCWRLAISKCNYGPSLILAELGQDGQAFKAIDEDGLIWIDQAQYKGRTSATNQSGEDDEDYT